MRWWTAAIALVVACGLPEEGVAPPDAAGPDVVAPPDAGDGAPTGDGGSDAVAKDSSVLDATEDAPAVTAGFALAFGGGSYVDMGVVPIPANFTVEAWIHPTTENNETYVVAEDERNQGQGQFRFGIEANKLFFLMSDASGSTYGLYNNGYSLESAQTIPLAKWTHVAVTKSGASFALVVNGAVSASFTASASFAHGGPATAFRVGARVSTNGTSPDGAFDGTIDEVRVWSVARTPAEIASTMSTTVSPASPGLFAYWRFDEGSGATTADEKNGWPGTLVSSPQWVVSNAF